MSTRVFALALTFCACACVLACDASAPDTGAKQAAPAGPTPAAAQPEAPVPAPAPAPEGGVSSMPEGQAPAWFSPEAFAHEQVIRHDQSSNKLPTGQSSRMLLLELATDVTPEQCIARAQAKLGETISELPAAAPTPQGYLMIKGQHADYEYSVVCGVAKGAPTLFLSFVQ